MLTDIDLRTHLKTQNTTGNNIIDNDIITVNGVPWPKMEVEPRVYRFRALIANINRAYRFIAVALNTTQVQGGKFPTLEYAEVGGRLFTHTRQYFVSPRIQISFCLCVCLLRLLFF